MEKKVFKELDYIVRRPIDFSKDKEYPLIIYLHGAGGRGRDIDLIYNHPFFKETEKFLSDAICVAPQCYEDSWFSIFEQLQEFVLHAISWDFVDSTRVYLSGASMGGYATWQLAMSRPGWFAAIIPICGGGMYWNAWRFSRMGVWAFHGEKDGVVLCEESRKMVNAINVNGGNAKLTIYENVAHDAWTKTFQNEQVWQWLLTHRLHGITGKTDCDNVDQFG